MTVRVGPGKGSFPWVNSSAAEKCKAKSKSDSTEGDSGFQGFFQANPKIFLFVGKQMKRFLSVTFTEW